MIKTSARLLHLLTLLQTRAVWTGPELVDELAVSPRTVRGDIEKLRELGYPVYSTPGAAGGYRLGPGAKLPPLLLDEDEAAAVALGLGGAAPGSVAGFEAASARALTKLDQVLPSRVRHRVESLQASTVIPGHSGAEADPVVLTEIAAAVRDHHRLRFDYRTHDGTAQRRSAEPHRLVYLGRRWYLVAWDLDRSDWRTFRVDRIRPRTPTGPRFPPREPPTDDLVAFVSAGRRIARLRYRAKVTVHRPAADLVGWMPDGIAVEPVDDHRCIVHAGGDTPHVLAAHITFIDADYEVDGSPEVLAALRTIGQRCAAAIPE
ncbi:transcriptional regulator [Nocardia sp. CDC159]|uniref:Transcriptional regulator n=1 Tax=Nocardia pulmonis TaxID=2951408 RepID=A0A9X2E372_9NOCA|nr:MULTISPECIES: transcriptional regulator [Nocardia]MCM6772020.1 transcriptional regulator [Nocardia pulmonis]MCM6785322.1 transcriptional regulator [Nocardia sp. CDC159]